MAAKAFAFAVFLALFAGVNAATIYETAKAAGLTTLVAAIDAAGLTKTLNDPNDKLTVFAPTNAAFDKALTELKLTAAQLLADKAVLTTVLEYHVLQGVVPSSKITTKPTKVKTLAGQYLEVEKAMSMVHVFFGKNFANLAMVVKADIKADKSIVHVVDTVLVPAKL